MKITFRQGRKGNNDRIIFIETIGEEALTLHELLTHLKLYDQNEINVNREKIERTGRYFLREAVCRILSYYDPTEKTWTYGEDIDEVLTEMKTPKKVKDGKI